MLLTLNKNKHTIPITHCCCQFGVDYFKIINTSNGNLRISDAALWISAPVNARIVQQQKQKNNNKQLLKYKLF